MSHYGLVVKQLFAILPSLVLTLSLSQSLWSQTRGDARRGRARLEILESNREKDGLLGPVRRVRTEVARVDLRTDAPVEGRRSLLEVTVYDAAGRRVENETYPVVNSPVGRETYEYDPRGRLLATTVRDRHGNILSRTVYAYEFDAAGNWVKMTSSVEVIESGRLKLEPLEVTYRTITYYAGGEAGGAAAAAAPEGRKAAGPAAARPAGGNSAPLGVRAANRSTAGAAADLSSADTGTPAGGAVPKAAAPGRRPAPAAAVYEGELTEVGLVNQKALSLPAPAFPVGWRKSTTPTVVAVEVVIDETGRVLSARAPTGPPALREVLEQAARRAVFLPFRAAGRPYKAKGLISYKFLYTPR